MPLGLPPAVQAAVATDSARLPGAQAGSPSAGAPGKVTVAIAAENPLKRFWKLRARARKKYVAFGWSVALATWSCSVSDAE